MAIPLTGVAGWFTRAGAFIGEVNRVAGVFYGSALDAGFQSMWSQFASSDAAAVQNLPAARDSFRQSNQQYLATVIGDGQQAAILQANDDAPLVPYTIQQAFTVVRDQMLATAQTINRPTIGSSVTASGSNLSDVTVAVGLTNQYGDPLDMTLAETVTATVTQATGGSSFGATITFVGQTAFPGTDYRWPGGSACNVAVGVTDPDSTTLVTDGGFASWTGTGSNTPVNWSIIDGAAGVTIFKGVGLGLRSSSDCAKVVSDGAQATKLGQNVSLSTNTVYLITVQAKVNSADGSGTLVLQLTDNNGNVIQDDAGTNLSFSRNMSAQVTTSFQNFNFFVGTPRQLPATVQVRYGFGVAPSAAKFLLLDLAAVVAATRLYAQGPFVAAVSGVDRPAFADTWAVALTNSLTSQSFARGFDRLYSLRGMVNSLGESLYFPSSNSPTLSDGLVTH